MWEENDYIVGVDDICHRDVVDFKCNSYCNTFIDFLISVNCCILNGRNFINNDFTCISTKGCSVVDYCIVPYEYLNLCSDFSVVRANDLVTAAGYDISGVDLKLIPDHSMIKWKVDLSSISSIVLPTHNDGMVTQHTKYNFKNIPTDDTYSEICSIINKFEVIKQEQKCINDIYIMSFVIP